MSAALAYHRATSESVERGWEHDDGRRFVGARPPLVKDYGGAERLPLESSVAGPLLQDAVGVVRSQAGRDYGGGTMHWRAYSSAGALYPVEAYVAEQDGLYSFDPLARALVRVASGDARAAVAGTADANADRFVVLTGVPGRTGWKYLERGYRHVWWDAGTMLANLLALAAADALRPRLYVAFADAALNDVLAVDGVQEYALAVLGLGDGAAAGGAPLERYARSTYDEPRRYPPAEAVQKASALADVDAVRAWRAGHELPGEEPRQSRGEVLAAVRRRRSTRRFSPTPLPREQLTQLLAWAEAPVPADAPGVVRQLLAVAAVEGLAAGVYDTRLELLRADEERDLRARAGRAAMEQEHSELAAVNVFQLAALDAVVARLGDRGYRWAQLEAGIRAGRLQVGAFMRGWGATATTFYDDEVPRLLETDEAPMLMVALGRGA